MFRNLGIGFLQGTSAPSVFFHPITHLRIVVHGDDLTCLGEDEHLQELERHLTSWYEIKVRGELGLTPGDDQEVTILNRMVGVSKKAYVIAQILAMPRQSAKD